MAMDSKCLGHRGNSSIGRVPALHAEDTGVDAEIRQVLRNSWSSRYSLQKDHILAIACLLASQIKLGAVAQLVRAPV